uniref:Uncharacterized protein n=2 Tax=Pandoraea faecigallinarum TaxID=656179 RepID=A0A0H3WST0_9BURK
MKGGDARSRAATSSGVTAALARHAHGIRRRHAMRGAALLDVMFTLTALMAGAQGFAHWQAAGGMSSAELAATPKVVMMAMPGLAGRDATPIAQRRWLASGGMSVATDASAARDSGDAWAAWDERDAWDAPDVSRPSLSSLSLPTDAPITTAFVATNGSLVGGRQPS